MTPVATPNLAAVLHRPGDLRLEERPVPHPGPGEVLVAVRAVGVCGSDIHYYETGRIGDFVVRAPLVLGHESSGVVVAHGAHARRHPLGQRVAVEPGVPCARCAQCRAGRYHLCPDVRFFGTPPVDGAFARYVVVPEEFAHPVPDTLSDDAAALVEPFSVGLWACRTAGVRPGESVLVTGAGPIGLLALQAARCHGATEITVTDVNTHRLKVAQRLGATRTHEATAPLDEEFRADVLIECSGAPAALREGIAALRPAGRAVLVGMGVDEVSLPLPVVQSREITIRGSFRYADTYPAAIALAAAGRADLDALVSVRFSLERAEEALRAPGADPTVIKTMVVPSAG